MQEAHPLSDNSLGSQDSSDCCQTPTFRRPSRQRFPPFHGTLLHLSRKEARLRKLSLASRVQGRESFKGSLTLRFRNPSMKISLFPRSIFQRRHQLSNGQRTVMSQFCLQRRLGLQLSALAANSTSSNYLRHCLFQALLSWPPSKAPWREDMFKRSLENTP